MTGEPKTGDRLLQLVDGDIEFMQEKFKIKPIVWCCDDGPDCKKMRCLLPEKFVWLIALVCWAHQINLIVGDFLSLKIEALSVVTQVLDIVRWFNNHGQPLAWLQAEQRLTYQGSFWALFLPVATRWLAHYLTFTRLLKVKAAVKSCWCRHEERIINAAGDAVKREYARRVLTPIGDETFWRKLSE